MKGSFVAVFLGLFIAIVPEALAVDNSVAQAKANLIDALWQYHMSVIGQVLIARSDDDAVIDLDAFRRSVDVVETLTNIPSNTGTRLGRLPSPELPEAMRQWDAWYARNRRRLDVSLDGCSLRLKP